MRYRHILIPTVALLALVALGGCKSEDETDVKFSSELLKLNATSIELAKEATTRTVSIEANCDWEVESSATGWKDLVVQKASDSSISITTEENPLRSDRTATLTITTKGGLKRSISVRQAQGSAYIRTSVDSLQFREDAGTSSFDINSNTSWEISISYPTAEDEEWLTIDEKSMSGSNNGKIEVKASKATTEEKRKATITIASTESGANVSKNVIVTQDAAKIEFTVSPTAINAMADKGEYPLTVKSNMRWTAETDRSWVKMDKASDAAGEHTINLTVEKNTGAEEREAHITVKSGSAEPVVVTITQDSFYIRTDVSNNTLETFGEDGGSLSFHLESNGSWKASVNYNTSGDSDWLRLDKDNGSGNADIKVTADKAVTADERRATINIESEDGASAKAQVYVVQKGLSTIQLEVERDLLSFGCQKDTKTINVTKSNARWKAMVPNNVASWVSISPTEGVLTGSISVTCEDYTGTGQPRQTVVTITSSDMQVQVAIEQEPATLPTVSSFAVVGSLSVQESAQFSFGFESVFPVTEYGLCYSATNKQPDINDTHVSQTANQLSATGLTLTTGKMEPRKEYYVRAYAKSKVGVGYSSNVLTIQTLGDAPAVDDNPPLFTRKR